VTDDRELGRLDATAQAELVRQGHVTPRELVASAIRRIEALDGALNAVVERRFERALARAGSVSLADGPFAGVPVVLKDVAVAGEPNALGCRLLAELDLRPTETDEFVRRTASAGMIVVGRTNVPELTSAATTESLLHGPCRNPWDTERSCGGSSGGAAVAVASGMVAAAQASDGGGSTRIPAAANGVVGLKPTRGRVTASPSSTAWVDISSERSWHTRSVRDTALLLDVVAGPGPGDTIAALPPVRPYADEVGAPPGRLRIGVATQLPGNPVPLSDEATEAVEAAARLVAELGHHVELATPSTLDTTEHFELILGYWPIKVAGRLIEAEQRLGRPIKEEELEPTSFFMLQRARQWSLVDHAAILQRIYDYGKRTLAWYRTGFDLLLTPTIGCPPPLLGVLTGPPGNVDGMRWGSFAPIANLTGQPAISLPLHWTADGLPLGVQFVADVGREDVLIRIASQLEAARPWRDTWPPAVTDG
jgi:amidase